MDDFLEPDGRKRQFLTSEHWRQLIPIIATMLIPLLVFLGMLWVDHKQVADNSTALASLTTQMAEMREKNILLEAHLSADEAMLSKIGSQMENLGTSVSNLTLAVQKLTDLLPERRR